MKLTTSVLRQIIKEEMANEGIMDFLKKGKEEPTPRNPKAAAAEEMAIMAGVFKDKIIPAIKATQGTSAEAIEVKERIMKEFDLEQLAELLKLLGYYSIS